MKETDQRYSGSCDEGARGVRMMNKTTAIRMAQSEVDDGKCADNEQSDRTAIGQEGRGKETCPLGILDE